MSRAIWEVELRQNMYTGIDENEVLEQTRIYGYEIPKDDLTLNKRVGEDLTQKLFMLAWRMSKEDIFSQNDIENCLEAILISTGMRRGKTTADIIDVVLVYLDRFEQSEEEDFLEWLTRN